MVHKPRCTYCPKEACAHLSRRVLALETDDIGPRWTCHQHVARALEDVAWNPVLKVPMAVWITPVGSLVGRMQDRYLPERPSAIHDILSRARLVEPRDAPPRDVVDTQEDTMETPPRLAVGAQVHYVSYGTPGGEYRSVCRAAIVTEVHPPTEDGEAVASLAVLNPTGMFFSPMMIEGLPLPAGVGGTWHWPEGE